MNRVLSGRLEEGQKRKSSKTTRAFLKKEEGAKARLREDENDKDKCNHATVDDTSVAQREFEQGSTCSICQDEMTESELDNNLLCYCHSSYGSSFHKASVVPTIGWREKLYRVLYAGLRGASLVPSTKSSNEDKYSTRTRLPSLKCSHCRLTIRNQVVRCASCPPLDSCQSCFNGGAGASQDHAHSILQG